MPVSSDSDPDEDHDPEGAGVGFVDRLSFNPHETQTNADSVKAAPVVRQLAGPVIDGSSGSDSEDQPAIRVAHLKAMKPPASGFTVKNMHYDDPSPNIASKQRPDEAPPAQGAVELKLSKKEIVELEKEIDAGSGSIDTFVTLGKALVSEGKAREPFT